MTEPQGSPSSRLYLDTQVMWDTLQTACCTQPFAESGESLFDASLSTPSANGTVERPVLEVACAHPGNINLELSDGGQSSPMTSVSIAPTSQPALVNTRVPDCPSPRSPSDNLWLLPDLLQDSNFANRIYNASPEDIEDSSWWELVNL